MASSMTVWQRPISLWRTNSPPQTFLLWSTDYTDFTDLNFCVICVICWLFVFNNRKHKFSQRDWTKHSFVFFCVICCLLNRRRRRNTQKLYMTVAVVISYFCAFCVFCGFPHQRIPRILVSFLHMFGNKLLSLSSKPMNSYNSLIIIDVTSYTTIKSPKIHWKSLLLYIFFANFLSSPFSKLPDPNDVVSSINAYGVNNWHLVS